MIRNSYRTLKQNIFHNNNLLIYLKFAESGSRTIYSRAALGVDGYVNTREKIGAQLTNLSEKFRMKMEEVSNPESKDLIFTEDLKNMIHIAQPKSEDIAIVVNMTKKFHAQNSEMRFGNFVFGPVVMRMFYYLNDHERAYKCFNDEALSGFFDQIMSYQILMDLLLIHGQYDKVLKVFEYVTKTQLQGTKYPKHIIVIVFATFYKQNTQESFKNAIKLWTNLMKVGNVPMRRAATFMAGLALRQKEPNIALEVLSTVKQQNYMSIRNLKVIALAELGRPADTIPVLRSVIEETTVGQPKNTFTREAVAKVREAVELVDNKSLSLEFKRIETIFSKQSYYSNLSITDMLCSEIVATDSGSPQNRARDRGIFVNRFKDRSANIKSNRLGLDYD